ncbi:hypothetical protein VF21_07439 [Pseudogymnoascus sp. 05NY08]|nr:hypothetical protein VF21_07439 [Pseudogymnoascus sp. 05NY08]
MAAGELSPVRPVLTMENLRISHACKEAWRVIWGPYPKIKFATGTEDSPYHNADWFDFSKTTFYLSHGPFSLYCVSALTPKHISTHVKRLAIDWSNYGALIGTCKRFTLFPNLQQLVILVPPHLNPRIAPPARAAITVLDLYLQGKICHIVDPNQAGSHLRDEVEKFVRFQCPHLGPKWPMIEAVLVPNAA